MILGPLTDDESFRECQRRSPSFRRPGRRARAGRASEDGGGALGGLDFEEELRPEAAGGVSRETFGPWDLGFPQIPAYSRSPFGTASCQNLLEALARFLRPWGSAPQKKAGGVP